MPKKSDYIRRGHVSISTKDFTFKAFSKSGKAVPLHQNFKYKKESKTNVPDGIHLSKGTKRIDTYYKGKKIASRELKASTKRGQNWGFKRTAGLLESSDTAPEGAEDLRSRINEVGGKGAFSHIESGYLPSTPYFKGGEFFKTRPQKARKTWRIYLMIKGSSYKGKKGKDETAYHLVSFEQTYESAQTGPQVYRNLFYQEQPDIPEELRIKNRDLYKAQFIDQHNLRLRGRKVKTKWFDDFNVLGVEAV